MAKVQYYGTGRRKKSVAKPFLLDFNIYFAFYSSVIMGPIKFFRE